MMSACPFSAPQLPLRPLIQIRRGYATDWSGLHLSVESVAEGWKAEVRDCNGGRTRYSAQRCSPAAAKLAAAEYVVFGASAKVPFRSPEALARQLSWNEYW